MGIIQSLSEFALRQFMGDNARVVLDLIDRFADQGQRMRQALQNANIRAWRTLEIALAGTSWWDQVRRALVSGEERAFAREIQSFLDATPLAELSSHPHSRQSCLTQLRQARTQGMIPGELSAAELKNQVPGWLRHADAQAILAADTEVLWRLANELRRQGYQWLGWLIEQRPNGGPPLLALAVRYFFRREVEADAELARGITFSQMEGLTRAQEDGFKGLAAVLAAHGQRMEQVVEAIRIRADGIHADIDALNRRVLDLRADLQRQDQRSQGLRLLIEDVLRKLVECQLHGRPVRPQDSLSIRNDHERELVKALLSRYRALPGEQRQASSALVNGLAQLELAAGDPESAQRNFAQAARLTPDLRAQAEAYHNAYRAGLARHRYDEAFESMRQALALDAARFSPFPLHEYEPLRILGAGGFGVTFLCQYNRLNNPIAVKALIREDRRNVGEVFQEARALDQLHHPAIIRFKHCGYADAEQTRPYVAMEYFEGQTLEQYVQTNGSLQWEDFKAVALLVAGALEAAHARDILHRDVKPANLLLRKAGGGWEVRLIDFGLALNQAALDAASTLRQAHGVTGTLDYAAPEQLGKLPGVQSGPPADVYGFAKTCCFALFGTPNPRDHHRRKVSPGMRRFLDDCLAEAPAERPPTFTEVLRRLRVRPPRPPGRHRLVVLRGSERGAKYPLRKGLNYLVRPNELPVVNVNLEGREPPDQTRSSLRHVVITRGGAALTIEDLSSGERTYLNRGLLGPGEKHPLQEGDTIQIGGVHLQYKVGRG